MTKEQTRRSLFIGAASVTGIVLAGGAMAQTAPAGVKVEYTPKKLPFDPSKVKGLSQKLLESHYENNYIGAVKRLNAITAQLASLDIATAPVFVVNGLKREELIATNSMIIHELYFDSLAGEGEPAGALAEAIARDFGVARALEGRVLGDRQGVGRRLGLGDVDLVAARQAAGQQLGGRPHHDPGRRPADSRTRHVRACLPNGLRRQGCGLCRCLHAGIRWDNVSSLYERYSKQS